MAITYAILGLLSWRPLSGYDVKKLLAGSTALYWSGNSNQVYPALVRLHDEGLVTAEVQQQEGYPAKKVYAITETGRAVLHAWVAGATEPPQIRTSFLTQLAWADQLDESELLSLLGRYEEEVRLRLLMLREQIRRKPEQPCRTPREEFLWAMIGDHDPVLLEAELEWIARLRAGLQDASDDREATP